MRVIALPPWCRVPQGFPSAGTDDRTTFRHTVSDGVGEAYLFEKALDFCIERGSTNDNFIEVTAEYFHCFFACKSSDLVIDDRKTKQQLTYFIIYTGQNILLDNLFYNQRYAWDDAWFDFSERLCDEGLRSALHGYYSQKLAMPLSCPWNCSTSSCGLQCPCRNFFNCMLDLISLAHLAAYACHCVRGRNQASCLICGCRWREWNIGSVGESRYRHWTYSWYVCDTCSYGSYIGCGMGNPDGSTADAKWEICRSLPGVWTW